MACITHDIEFWVESFRYEADPENMLADGLAQPQRKEIQTNAPAARVRLDATGSAGNGAGRAIMLKRKAVSFTRHSASRL